MVSLTKLRNDWFAKAFPHHRFVLYGMLFSCVNASDHNNNQFVLQEDWGEQFVYTVEL